MFRYHKWNIYDKMFQKGDAHMGNDVKNNILVAFNNLIEKNDFDKITVQMILDEAHIGRATFYRYFRDKYDVMNYNYVRFLEEYIVAGKIKTFEDFFLIMTSDGTEFFRNKVKIFNSTGVNSFENFMYEASFNMVKLVFLRRGKLKLTPTENIQYRFLCHGIPHLYEDWIKGKYPGLTPEEAAKAIYDLLPAELQGDLW